MNLSISRRDQAAALCLIGTPALAALTHRGWLDVTVTDHELLVAMTEQHRDMASTGERVLLALLESIAAGAHPLVYASGHLDADNEACVQTALRLMSLRAVA